MAETVTLPKEEYDELCREVKFLDALRAAGVDNWCGYDMAQELYDEADDA